MTCCSWCSTARWVNMPEKVHSSATSAAPVTADLIPAAQLAEVAVYLHDVEPLAHRPKLTLIADHVNCLCRRHERRHSLPPIPVLRSAADHTSARNVPSIGRKALMDEDNAFRNLPPTNCPVSRSVKIHAITHKFVPTNLNSQICASSPRVDQPIYTPLAV